MTAREAENGRSLILNHYVTWCRDSSSGSSGRRLVFSLYRPQGCEGLAPPNSAGFCKIPAERMLPSPSKVGLYELESTIVPLPFGVMAHPLFRTRLTTGHWLLGEPPTARGVKRIEVRASFGVLGRLPQGNNYSLSCLLLRFVACYCIISRVQVKGFSLNQQVIVHHNVVVGARQFNT